MTALVTVAIVPAWLACVAGWAIVVLAHHIAEALIPQRRP